MPLPCGYLPLSHFADGCKLFEAAFDGSAESRLCNGCMGCRRQASFQFSSLSIQAPVARTTLGGLHGFSTPTFSKVGCRCRGAAVTFWRGMGGSVSDSVDHSGRYLPGR